MKKFLALLLALVMVFGLVACGGGNQGGAPAGGNDAPAAGGNDAPAGGAPGDNTKPVDGPDGALPDMAVAMITDFGDITDQSFNQTTYEACRDWCLDNGVSFTYKKPAGDSTAERVAMIEAAVDEGYNVIVMPGYAFAEAVVETSGLYPDVKFVALDVAAGDLLSAALGDQYDWNPDNWVVSDHYHADNVYCAVYQEELCGYMSGYATVSLGYRHLGYLGGMAVPAVVRFGYGFLQGANAAAEKLGVTGDVVVEYCYGNQFFGDADITAVMDTWYSNLGVEAVFACGGGIYTSAGEAAAKVGGKVIGVDVDQSGIIDGAYGAGMTITSAMKGLAPTVKTVLTEILAGNFGNYGGKIENLGLVSGDDPTVNYVQIPMDTTAWGAGFTQDDYKALVKDMYTGAVTVSNDISAMPAVSITINDHGNIK